MVKNLILSTFFLSSAYAGFISPVQYEIKCEENFQQVKSAFRAHKKVNLDCDDVARADEAIKKVSEISPLAPRVNLQMYNQYPSASFDLGETIIIPQRLTHSNRWGRVFYRSAFDTTAILYHEYAHAVFTEYFARKFYPKLQQYAQKLSRYKIQLQRNWARGNPSNMAKYFQSKISTYKELVKKNDNLKTYGLTKEYNEFFADLVAVLITEDVDSIYNALYYDAMSDKEYQTIRLRAFSDQGLDYKNQGLGQIHGKLAFVRRYIGTQLLPELFDLPDDTAQEITYKQAKKKELIMITLQAIEKQIKKRQKEELYQMAPKVANTLLIKEIKELL